jgi:hypothetical protein
LDLARSAQVTVSGEKPGFPATNATDGNRATEWIAVHGQYDLQDPKQMRPWIKLQWAQPVTVGRLVISDRADPKQNVQGGKVLFSDGSTVDVDDIPIDGTPCEVSFPARKVAWLKINFYSSRGDAPGLAELEVYADTRPMPKTAQAAPPAPGTVVDINGNDPRIKTEGNIRGGEWSAAMWCQFAGTKVTLVGNTGPANGIGDVYLDGIFQKRVDWYSAQDAHGVPLFSAENLADGKHLLGVMARGIKRAESTGTSINWTDIQYVAGEHPDQFTPVARTQFDPNVPLWLDNNGDQIQCHMGGISYFDGTYYLLGCDWRGKKLPDFGYGWIKNVGFTIYSSPDLMNWTYRGNFLKPVSDPKSPLYDYAHGIGRVRLLRARGTGKYVAIFQIVDASFSSTDDPNNVDTVNNVGIALADKPEGPYEWHGFLQYKGKKVTAADNAIFTDDDGKQYFVNGPPTPGNISDWLYELAPDCLSAVKLKHLCTGGEGDAFFKHDGVYFLVHSHLLGMTPTDNFYHTATNIWGPWTAKGNIAQGEHSEVTFRTQTMDVVQVAGKKDAFMWIGDSLRNGEGNAWNRTVWLPVTFKGDGEMEVRWRDSWDMSVIGH